MVQNRKTLDILLRNYLYVIIDRYCLSFIFRRDAGHWNISSLKFETFLKCPKFLRFFFSCVGTEAPPVILSLRLFSNSKDYSKTKVYIIDIHFTCGE